MWDISSLSVQILQLLNGADTPHTILFTGPDILLIVFLSGISMVLSLLLLKTRTSEPYIITSLIVDRKIVLFFVIQISLKYSITKSKNAQMMHITV